MLTLYFSGTGNTKYIAEKFAENMQADCHSIEEEIDFASLISAADKIAICYPIYGSCVPEIMRSFVDRHKKRLDGKKLIILCTQLLFSGDGARVLTDLLTETQTEIIYAEHINMPNNICNFFLLPLAKAERINKYVKRADIKLAKVTQNIKSGIIKKRGFNQFSKLLGLLAQRLYFQKIEQKTKQDVRINSKCNQCGICTRICPTSNLKLVNNKIEQKGLCTLCYRCVNTCPQQAITVFLHSRVKHQYKGPI